MRGNRFIRLLGLIWLGSALNSASLAAIDESALSAPYLQTSSQEMFARELESQAVPLSTWLHSIAQERYNFICLGESHTSEHRRLMSEQVFPSLSLDHLLLEISKEQLPALESQGEAASLLGAPIGPLLHSVRLTSPGFSLWGVDITQEQRAYSNLNPNKTLARDGWIASNILNIYQPGQRTVALYGASHCAKHNVDSGWVRPFYSMLHEALPETEKMLSVKVVVAGGKVSYPLSTEDTVLLYLKDSSLHGTSFVLPNLPAIAKASYNSKVSFTSLFDAYDALVVLWLP